MRNSEIANQQSKEGEVFCWEATSIQIWSWLEVSNAVLDIQFPGWDASIELVNLVNSNNSVRKQSDLSWKRQKHF